MKVVHLGVIEFSEADALMSNMQKQRISNEIEDTLLICEHPEVVTIGPKARNDGVQAPASYLTVDVDRGGGLTWHGKGQIVIYPIIHWNQADEANVSQIIHKLEEWIITALSDHNISATRDERMQGVWVDGHKIASIGLSFLRWVSRHGFTINVDTPAGRVENLAGCGMSPKTTTSLNALGHEVAEVELIDSLLKKSEEILGRNRN
jgi:lipoyl(octanoyl) transferase